MFIRKIRCGIRDLKNQVSTRVENKRSENAQSISSTADADNNSASSTSPSRELNESNLSVNPLFLVEENQLLSSTPNANNNSVHSTNLHSPLVNIVDIYGQDETIDDFSHDLDQGNRPPPENSSFWLRVMHCLAISGGVCAMVALLTCPPFAAALGLSTLCGVGINAISVTAGLLAGTSALFALGLFAATRTPQNPGNSLNNVRPS